MLVMQVIYLQLRPGNSYSLVSWKRMFEVLLQICALYAGIEADTRVRPPITSSRVCDGSCQQAPLRGTLQRNACTTYARVRIADNNCSRCQVPLCHWRTLDVTLLRMQGDGLGATIQREPTVLSDTDTNAVIRYLRLFR